MKDGKFKDGEKDEEIPPEEEPSDDQAYPCIPASADAPQRRKK